jgi:hypothetical protein
MKNKLIIMILLCLIIIICKYRFSNYSIEYRINNYDIKEIYKDKRFYYEIKDSNYTYNFDIYMERSFNKTMISKINEISDENINCIYPIIEDIKTYPLCYLNGEYTDYNLIDSELLIEYKKNNNIEESNDKDFVYNKNLTKDEYIALWNYKGYIVMNGENYKNIDLFKQDKYDNSLAYLIDDSIYMANNDEEHEYTKLIKFNLTNLKKSEINIGYNIDFDSYIVGSIKNKLYLFDNKYSILYEIDVKKEKTTIIGNNDPNQNETKGIIKSKEVRCPKCQENILLKFDNYNITLYNCKNKHKEENISFNRFVEIQKIDLSKIICNSCKERNKSNVSNNEFYKCITRN